MSVSEVNLDNNKANENNDIDFDSDNNKSDSETDYSYKKHDENRIANFFEKNKFENLIRDCNEFEKIPKYYFYKSSSYITNVELLDSLIDFYNRLHYFITKYTIETNIDKLYKSNNAQIDYYKHIDYFKKIFAVIYKYLIIISIKNDIKIIQHIRSKINIFKEVNYLNLRPYFKYLYVSKNTHKLSILLNTFYRNNTYIFLLDYLKYLKNKKTTYYYIIKELYLLQTHIYNFNKINYDNFIDIIKISKSNNLNILHIVDNAFIKEKIISTLSQSDFNEFSRYNYNLQGLQTIFEYKNLWFSSDDATFNNTYENTFNLRDGTSFILNYDNLINLHNKYNKTTINTNILDNYAKIHFENQINIPFGEYSNLFFYNYYKQTKNTKVIKLPIYTNIYINIHLFMSLVYFCVFIHNDELFKYDLEKNNNNHYIEFFNSDENQFYKYKNILMEHVKLFFTNEYFNNNLVYFENLFNCFKDNLYNCVINNTSNNKIKDVFIIDGFYLKGKIMEYIDDFKYIKNPTLLQKYLFNLIIETNIQNIV